MTRAQLEHIIRAAGAIADTQDVVVIGSQAVLGQFPDAPQELLVSSEADVFLRSDPGRSELIDGSIGEGSPFQREFGYYAHGVDETTAVLPEGWRGRLILITGEKTRFVRGWCLEIHDLAIAKYEQRLAVTAVEAGVRGLIAARIQQDFESAGTR
jgi:hypothetical protein